jgi:hypothetical protein
MTNPAALANQLLSYAELSAVEGCKPSATAFFLLAEDAIAEILDPIVFLQATLRADRFVRRYMLPEAV